MKLKSLTAYVIIMLLLVGCTNQNSLFDDKSNIEGTRYTMLVSNNNSTDKTKNDFNLNVTNVEGPFHVELKNEGRDREMIMTVYYDYKQIDFRVDDGSYLDNYIFSIQDGEKKNISFYIDNVAEADDLCHKLLINFTASPNIHSKDINNPSYQYGISSIYNLYYDSNSDATYIEAPEAIIPKNIFSNFISAPLVINMDYDNVQQKESILEYPEKVLRCRPNEQIKLMYNISDEEFKNALVILNVGYQQTQINNNPYLMVSLEEANESVFNDYFQFIAPEEDGIYEVIGFVIFDPFTKEASGINNVYTSIRFSLEVQDSY